MGEFDSAIPYAGSFPEHYNAIKGPLSKILIIAQPPPSFS